MQRDPTSVPSHNLEDHHAIVRGGRCVEPIESLRGDVDRGHEPECQLGRGEIVVDSFRDADNRESALMKLLRDRQRTFAAESYKRLYAENIQVRDRLAYRHLRIEWFALDHPDKASLVSRPKNCPAPRKYSADAFLRQDAGVRLAQNAL